MKKILVVLSLLFICSTVDAQVPCVPIDSTVHLLKNAIDHMAPNQYGVKRVDLGWWDEFNTHYWLTHDDEDGYVLSKMIGEVDFAATTLIPTLDGHGFMVHPKSKRFSYLLKEVSKIIYERNIIPSKDFDQNP
jgi:hypothetical protein